MFKKTVRNAVIIAFAAVILLGGAAFSLNKSQVAKKVSITKKVKVYENTETNKLHPYLSITRSFYSKKSESGMSSRCFFYNIKEKKRVILNYHTMLPLVKDDPQGRRADDEGAGSDRKNGI